MRPGIDSADIVVVLSEEALSTYVQDVQSAMGLAMTSKVRVTSGTINDWIAWEPSVPHAPGRPEGPRTGRHHLHRCRRGVSRPQP